MGMRRGRLKTASIFALTLTILLVIVLRYCFSLDRWEPRAFAPFEGAESDDGSTRKDVELVVASMSYEDTSWLHRFLPDWKKNVYIVDDPLVNLTLPMNKGRESMVYLT